MIVFGGHQLHPDVRFLMTTGQHELRPLVLDERAAWRHGVTRRAVLHGVLSGALAQRMSGRGRRRSGARVFFRCYRVATMPLTPDDVSAIEWRVFSEQGVAVLEVSTLSLARLAALCTGIKHALVMAGAGRDDLLQAAKVLVLMRTGPADISDKDLTTALETLAGAPALTIITETFGVRLTATTTGQIGLTPRRE